MNSACDAGAPETPWALRKKVLVVDDNAVAADALAQLLQILGWEALSICSAKEARAYLTDTSVDIILLDIEMPDMDGYQLATLLRNDMHLTIPIVALTGRAPEEIDEKARAAGFTVCLTKPIGGKELHAVMTTLVA